MGRTVLNQSVALQARQREVKVNVDRLDPGMYFMNLRIGGDQYQYRLIKN
ncbi:MAG: T9SS type A sorting domain-containing protein [Cytophagales bacterium]|nr:T9SS type A sorting domain-containing protein [Cytophagales bacterium]